MRGTAWIPVATGAVALAALLWAEVKQRPAVRAVAKVTCSAGFLALALLLGIETPYARTILAGLLLAAVGDVLLLSSGERRFLAGLVAFLLCHVAYAIAFARPSVPSPWTGAIVLGLGAGILRWLWPHLAEMKGAVAVYCAVISAMVWLALGLPRAEVAVGAVFFYVSDVLLARDRFVRSGVRNQLILLPLYFAGQYLIASSVG